MRYAKKNMMIFTALAWSLFLSPACDESDQPLNWPSFDEKVIEAGRAAFEERLAALDAAVAARFNAPPVEPVDPIPATREAILETIKGSHGQMTKPAKEAIRNLGQAAVDPLIEILADDSVPERYTDRAFMLLIPSMRDEEDSSWRLDREVILASREKVFDAIVAYAERRPDLPTSLRDLKSITPRSRLPKLIELIESTSGERQRSYIQAFCAVTDTQFPTIPEGFCGNSSAESIRQAIEEGTKQQQAGVADIKAWWAGHKDESAEEWLADALRRDIAARSEETERFIPLVEQGLHSRDSLTYHIREFRQAPDRAWSPSAFGLLVEEFERAPDHSKPFVLRLIGLTQHPNAAAFAATRLNSKDPNVQYAAIEAAKDLHAAGLAQGISQVLRTTGDDNVAKAAVEALQELSGVDALEDFVYALKDPDSNAARQAKEALGPFLVSHAAALRKIAESHPSRQAGQLLNALLDGAAAVALAKSEAEEGSRRETIASARELLKSDDDVRQGRGLGIAAGHYKQRGSAGGTSDSPPLEYPELIPDVLPLIRSRNGQVYYAAIGLVQHAGIPGLTVDNARDLTGYSFEVDCHIAAFCYAKYGRKALPLVRDVAVNPPSSTSYPAVGLVRMLVREEMPGIEKDLVELVKRTKNQPGFVCLLDQLDDQASADFLGELLTHEENWYRREAIQSIGARRIKQHADALFAIASVATNQVELDRLGVAFERGEISQAEYYERMVPFYGRPAEQFEATMALIAMDDPRAWHAVRICLESKYLDSQDMGTMLSGHTPAALGAAAARLKSAHRADIDALLREELAGSNRRRLVDSMTTALSLEPDPEDAELLWTVASTGQARVEPRILAAVALSKLGDPRVIPVLHELMRAVLTPQDGQPLRYYPGGMFSLLLPSTKAFMTGSRSTLLDFRPPRAWPHAMYENHHVDLGLALRRLGDETMVVELTDFLVDGQGYFQQTAYRFLAGNIGLRAYEIGRQRMVEQKSANSFSRSSLITTLLGAEVPLDDVLPMIMSDPFILQSSLDALLYMDTRQTAEALVAAFPRPSHHDVGQYRARILDALCRIGDRRGLTLAADNPLLFASVAKYLPEADPVDFPAGHLEYNRIEEAMRVANWYRQHAEALKWDAKSGTFRLAAATP